MSFIASHNKASQQEREDTGQFELLSRLGILFFTLLMIFIIARYAGLFDDIMYLKEWIKQQGIAGIAVFILLYVTVMTMGLPRSGFTVLGGIIFGALWGTIIVTIASVCGAGLAFLIARYYARDYVEKWVQSKPKLNNLYNFSESYGAFIVAIVRMIPLSPANLLNFAFGLTRIQFGSYLFWTSMAMIPGNTLLIIGTDAIVDAFFERQIPWSMLGVVLALTGLLLLLSRAALIYFNKCRQTRL
jgi:uncharacterized membrane protein YdjX (TVP38/TMEM64 family)